MTAEDKLKHLQKHLKGEEEIKRQLADEYANADSPDEINLINETLDLVKKHYKQITVIFTSDEIWYLNFLLLNKSLEKDDIGRYKNVPGQGDYNIIERIKSKLTTK